MLKKGIVFIIYFIVMSSLLRLSDHLMDRSLFLGVGLKSIVYLIIGWIIYNVINRKDTSK